MNEMRKTGTVMRGIIDSGAVDQFTSRDVASQCLVKHTSAVGIEYKAANGETMYNEGQKDLKGFMANGMPIASQNIGNRNCVNNEVISEWCLACPEGCFG